MTYVRPEIETSADVITQDMYDLVSARVSGWQPSPASLDTAILEAAGREAAEERGLIADVMDEIYIAFGVSIVRFPMITATPATGVATFTFLAAAPTGGYLVPAGTQIAGTAPDASLVAFETTVDTTSATSATTLDVPIQAVIAGTPGNGITGSAVMIDAVPFIDTVSITTTTSDALDAETSQAYLDRLTRRMQLVAVHPILAPDFALLAADQPGVFRALAIDGYDPVADTTGNDRTVAVILQGSDGQAVSGGIKTAVDAVLQADREANFVVLVADPLITSINVATTVVKTPSADSTAVHDAVDAAILAFLNPATWGGPKLEGDPAWSSKPIVRIDELRSAIYQVTGVDHVSALTINTGTSDITLSSGKPHAIPQPGTHAVTVT